MNLVPLRVLVWVLVFLPGVLLGRLFFLVQDGAGTFALSLGSL